MAKKGDIPDWLDEDDLFADDDDPPKDEVKSPPVLKRGGGAAGADDAPAARMEPEPDGEPAAKKPSLMARLAIQSKRPGDQEITKSPLVMSLGGGALVLAVVAGAVWFIIGRDTVTRERMAIEAALSEQRYNEAIKSLDAFLGRHPRDKYTAEATVLRARARVDQATTGSAPNWKQGMVAMDQFIEECRDLDLWQDQYPLLLKYAEAISIGALESAERSKNRELMDVSEQAELLVDRFAGPDEPPTAIHQKIKLAREKTETSIRKYEATQATYKEIEQLLARGRPIEALTSRRRLLDRYSDLKSDRKLADLLEKTLVTEQKLVQIEDRNDNPESVASTQDRPLPVPEPVSLTLHTRARTDETSEGRTVFAVSQGCCYGIDTVTGDPVWRRAIGPDSPFFPVSVETTVPGLLLFDTRWQELVLLNRLTGKLLWRQPVAEPVSGEPLIHADQIYLPTLGNHLYKIELQTGLLKARVTFSQPVYSPPVLARDGEHLVVAGNEAVTYTIVARELQCVRVSFTGQSPGTISVPLLAMGDLVLMIENDQASASLLRVLDASSPAKNLPELQTLRVSSHVRDRAVLRGNQLFVPAEGEQFNVFTVSDEPNKTPLSAVARPPGTSSYQGQVHLLAGPDGRLWSASDTLRQYQLSQDALLENQKKKISIAAAGQPLQNVGRTLYVGRQLLESHALSFAQVDGEEMTSEWRTVLGAGLLAALPVSADSLLCLTRSGQAFQLGAADLTSGGFRMRVAGELELPEGLADPLRACELPGGQVAVVCGGEKARLWIVNQAGKAGQEFPLEAGSVADPVPLAGGAVVALPDRLRVLGSRGGSVEDYLGTVDAKDRVQWSSLLPVDENHIIVVDVQGKVTRLQFRTTPSSHLQPVSSLELGQPVDVQPVVSGGSLILADASGRVQILNTTDFERASEAQLPAPAVGHLGLAGNRLLVETAQGRLVCLALDQELKSLWSMDLAGDHLSGQPLLEGDTLLLATMNGSVVAVQADSGDVLRNVQLDQSLERGPLRFGQHVLVSSIDGSLYRVESVLAGKPVAEVAAP